MVNPLVHMVLQVAQLNAPKPPVLVKRKAARAKRSRVDLLLDGALVWVLLITVGSSC